MQWRIQLTQFKVDSEKQIFLSNFAWQFYIYYQSLCRKFFEKVAEEIFFHVSFWGLNHALTSDKPTHYLLDYGGFNTHLQGINSGSLNQLFASVSLFADNRDLSGCIRSCNSDFLTFLKFVIMLSIVLNHDGRANTTLCIR